MYVTLIKAESSYLLEICIRHIWLQLLTQAAVHKMRGAFRGTFSAYSRIGLALLYCFTFKLFPRPSFWENQRYVDNSYIAVLRECVTLHP